MSERHFKTLKSGQLKEASEGKFKAVFATLNVIDKDGDVIVSGAIDSGQKVRISAYNHSSWGGAKPVGKGVITEQDNELIVDGEFFMNTQDGRETFEIVKGLEDLTEYSFGFDIQDAEFGQFDGQDVQFLKRLNVYEVSPVLLGAGENTRTLDVKSKTKQAIPEHETDTVDKEWDGPGQVDSLTNEGGYSIYRNMYAWVDPEGERENKSSYKFPHHEVSDGMPGAANVRGCVAAIAALNGARGGADIPDGDRRGVWNHLAKHLRDAGEEPPELKTGETFSEEADRVHADVEKLVSRCHDIVEMRKAKGKSLGSESKDRMYEIRDRLDNAVKEIDELFAEDDYEQQFIDAMAKLKLQEIE